ncbi:NAD(P)-binding protein [Linnemannia elongata AG-77]|uniref:NAD(P)-binding protein n=1 Tax=Linnemannia elongata AG-77 TaxID=1314771 RepID=A0A197KG69_9FUNG|nr:NAD(P)-binding protein [Linnemannia elongata AG-77]
MTKSQITNNRVYIAQIPEGVAPNKNHFRTVTTTEDKPELEEGSVFVKNILFSLDPYIRYDFAEGAKETEVIGFGFSKVLESRKPNFHVGSSYFFGFLPWSSYSVLRSQDLSETFNIDSIDKDIPLSVYSGILGASGLTVWDSINRVADLKKGETIYISSAAGTLGQLAGQIAKRKGLRVIGSAGTDEKVAYLKNQLGFDAAFNYKTQDKREALTAAVGPQGLDVYYDLVFDNTVEIALDLFNPHGRVVTVGLLAGHKGQELAIPKNIVHLLLKQIRWEGYTVFEHFDQFENFWKEVTPLVKSGEFKYTQTVVDGDVGDIAETYLRFLEGAYQGKVSLKLGDF